jgi:protein-S-isoprenylcysteine O-methyltransferase Ste14
MITFTGLGLAVQSWPAVLVLLLVFGVAYGYRMQVEEATLASQLGEAYVAYTRRTKRLVPYLV